MLSLSGPPGGRKPLLCITLLLAACGAFCETASAQCTLTLTPSAIHVSAAQSTGQFAISASNANCPRTAKSNVSWIVVAFGQAGNGTSGSVGYTIEGSTLYTARTGTISVSTASSTATFT